MKPARTRQRRAALLAGAVPFTALLCGASLAMAMPFPGPSGSLAAPGASAITKAVHQADAAKQQTRIDAHDAFSIWPASALFFIGGLISMAGFTGVNRRVMDQLRDISR